MQKSIEIKLAKKKKKLQIVAKIKVTKDINKKLTLIELEDKMFKNKLNKFKKIKNSINIDKKKTNNLFKFFVDLKRLNLYALREFVEFTTKFKENSFIIEIDNNEIIYLIFDN